MCGGPRTDVMTGRTGRAFNGAQHWPHTHNPQGRAPHTLGAVVRAAARVWK